jgi:predicted Zn-dependent peptidase
MKRKKDLFLKIVLIAIVLILLISLAAPAIFSQTSLPAPKRETLLNGARVLTFPDKNAEKVWVRIRIHSGSAFDPQGKEGTMALLSRHIFPNAATRDYFEEDLGGSLSVECGYDYIEITASARPEEFLSMLETLSTAVSSPAIDRETTERLKNEMLNSPALIAENIDRFADMEVKKRLFGSFPYGRPVLGSKASLAAISFADVIDARKRFLNADNTTIAISGKFDRALAVRAVKRYFGGWLKSDRKVPSTFRQPDDPPAELAVINFDGEGVPVFRIAFRGIARADKDFAAAEVFAGILQSRFRRKAIMAADEVTAVNAAYTLPGYIIIGFPAKALKDTDDPSETIAAADALLREPISTQEFELAKQQAAAKWRSRPYEEFWLDADTYKIASPENDLNAFDALDISSVRSLAERFNKQPRAVVLVIASAKSK